MPSVPAGRPRLRLTATILMVGCLLPVGAAAQDSSAPPAKRDTRTQLPEFLWDAYLGLNIG
jgi:hypothetical protein